MARPLRLDALRLRREFAPTEWNLPGLAGRLVEISGDEKSAGLSFAGGLVHEAQQRGEPAAWVTPCDQSFFPPDFATGGIDLDALAVVRVPRPRLAGRAADQLVRSGAFGLVVLDLPDDRALPLAMQSRLLGVAQKHACAVLFLSQKRERAPSLGPLVSLRAQASKKLAGADRFACELRVIKDKRRAPGWSRQENRRGPVGLH